MKNIVIVLVGLTGFYLGTYGIGLPWGISQGMTATVFFWVAHLIREKSQDNKNGLLNMKIVYLVLGILVVSVTIYINKYVNIRTGQYGNIFLFWLNGVSTSIIL